MKIPYYSGNIYDSRVIGHLTIEQWVNSHKNPKPEIVKLLNEVASAGRVGNNNLKQKLKTKLFYITPSVYIGVGIKRQYANIEYFTGLVQLDWDHINSLKEAQELRDYIFDMYDCIVCSYLSPSRLGVKAIMQIPRVKDIEEYKDYFAAIETEMKQQNKGFDHATSNAVLPMFISADPDIKYRDDATIWDIKEDRTVDYKHLNSVESSLGRGMTDITKSLHTIEQFKRKINEILDGDGHPRMRAACLVLGSRVGAGYLDMQQAIELAEYCLSSNAYLNRKYKTYIKSAYWAIKSGSNNPQYF